MSSFTPQHIFRSEDAVLSFDHTEDITGWAITFKLSAYPGAAVQVTKTGSIVSATDGTFTVSLVQADTSGLTLGNLYYEVYRSDSGSEKLLFHGRITVSDRVA